MHKHLWNWHRRVGALVAVVVIILCVTGIGLNHTDQLGLGHRHVQADWILDWYGIETPESARVIQAGDTRVSLLGDHLYAGDKFIGAPHSELVGATLTDGLLVIVTGSQLLLLTHELELVEQIGVVDGLPAGIVRMGTTDQDQILLETASGLWAADKQLLGWTPGADAADTRWIEAGELHGEEIAAVAGDYRGRILSWERVFLDAHSGRLLGAAGPIIMDLVALMMLALSGSGLWLWSRRLR